MTKELVSGVTGGDLKNVIDYAEQDIYEYFGADNDIWKADRHELLGIIGGMSGILELI